MNIARLINFNSCDGVAYSEIQLKAITPTIATSEPFPLCTLSSPAQWAFCLAVCKGKEDVNAPHTFGLMCQVFFCVFSSLLFCSVFVFIAVLITSCTAQPTEVINYSRIHYTRMGNLNFAHATPPPPLNPCPKPFLNSHQSAHTLPFCRVFSGRHYAANRTQLADFNCTRRLA